MSRGITRVMPCRRHSRSRLRYAVVPLRRRYTGEYTRRPSSKYREEKRRRDEAFFTRFSRHSPDAAVDAVRGRHLFGTRRRISCRVRRGATPRRDTGFVARVTGTSRSRKGPTARFRDRRNRASRGIISDATRVAPYWCRNGYLENHGIPRLLLHEIERKKERVRNRYVRV